MQPLELLPPAPVSTNSTEPASPKAPSGEPAPDGEFGRLMERAMAPDQKSKTHPGSLQRKANSPGASKTIHTGKSQPAAEAAVNDASHVKTKTAASQPDGSPVAAKETNTSDLTAVPTSPADDSNSPLPVFLSLPLIEHPEAGNADAEKMTLAGNCPVVPSVPAMDVTKALPTITSGQAVAAIGNNPGPVPAFQKIEPDKSATKGTGDKSGMEALLTTGKMPPVENQNISADAISPAASNAELMAPQPATDAKAVVPPTRETSTPLESIKVEQRTTTQASHASTPSEPMNAGKPTAVHMDLETSNLPTSIPIPTRADDKLQAVTPINAPQAESLKNDGTGVAITPPSMKNSDKTNKVAGLDVQVLPGGTNGTSRETILPVHATVTAVRSSEKQNLDFNLPLPSTDPAPVNTAETSSVVTPPSLSDARMREVERTHDLVSINALRMVESKSDSLQVVIKPGAGTELSLELRHRNGTVEAEAVLQRGDYQLMNQHWPELQQKLEQRGIKLAPLAGETSFSTTGNGNTGTGNFSRQQSSREEAAQQASAFAEFTVAMNRGGATARLAPAIAGGWESWA
jgi:hypothetical protein